MRFPQLTAAAAICLSLAAPASAQEAGDCDMLCRLKGYLSTDHMAGDAAGDTHAAAPAKAHRQHTAAVHKPAATPKPVAAASPPAVAPKPAPEERADVKASAPAKRDARAVRPAPVRAAAIAPPAPAKLAAAAPPAPKITADPVPVVKTRKAAAEPARVRVAAAPRRVSAAAAPASTRTASLATAIPGSAPAMQAGFH